MNDFPVALTKFLTRTGFCLRGEAKRFVRAGQVTVDGATADFDTQVDNSKQAVTVDGKTVSVAQSSLAAQGFSYLAL